MPHRAGCRRKNQRTLRRKAAPKLAKEISGQLKDLGFKQSCSKCR